MKRNRVARGVRVKLNDNFKEKCLSDKYLKEETVIYISDEHIYNDALGEYVFVGGGSLTNSGTAYLTELTVVYDVPEKPLY